MKIKHVTNKFFLIFIFLFLLLSCKAQNEIALQFVEDEKGSFYNTQAMPLINTGDNTVG